MLIKICSEAVEVSPVSPSPVLGQRSVCSTEAIVVQERKDVTVTRWSWIRTPLKGMHYYFLIFTHHIY